MLIEALKSLKVRLPNRDIQLRPGYPEEIPDEYVQRLLAIVPHKVKVVAALTGPLKPGHWIEYESPLFGLLRGELLEVFNDGFLEVFHPLMRRLARIPVGWVRKVNEIQQ